MKIFNIFTTFLAATATMITVASSPSLDITQWINEEANDDEVIFNESSNVGKKLADLEYEELKDIDIAEAEVSSFEEQRHEETDLFIRNQQLNQLKHEINQLIADIANPDRSTIYQDLFTPDWEFFKPDKWAEVVYLEDKMLFKLSHIIQEKIMNKFDSGVWSWSKPFDEIFLLTWGDIEFLDKGNEYVVPLKINLVKDSTIIKKWNQRFVWKPKLHYTKHNSNKAFGFVSKAFTFSLDLDKKMFSESSSFITGWDLFNYLKGGLRRNFNWS